MLKVVREKYVVLGKEIFLLFALRVRLRRKRLVLKKRIGKRNWKAQKNKSKLEKLEKAVDDDKAKIQNTIGVAERMMACACQELEKSIC